MSNFDELVKRARARVEKRRAELGYGEVPKGFTLVNDEEFKEPLRFISSPESEKLDTDIDIPEPVTVGGLLNDGTSGAMQASIGLGRGVVNTADFIGTQVVHNPRELFTKGLDGDFKFIEPNTARALNLMTGYDPKAANSIIEANKSSAYHQQQRELQQDYNNAQTLTDKFLVGTKTITKPNVAASTVGQLAVDVASGAGVGKVFGAGRTATALGETAVVFNHMLNQTLDETGSVTPTQAAKLASGALVSYGLSRYLNGGANLENVLSGNAVKGANAVVNVGKEGLQETLQGATESSATQSAINLDGSVDMGQVAFDAGAEGAFGTALGTATQTMQGLSKTKEITQAGVNKAGESIKKNYGDTYENLLNPEHKKYNPTDAYLKAQQENNEEMQKHAYEHARNHEDPSYLRDILTHARITTYQDGEQLDNPEYFSNLANSYQQATSNTIKPTGKTITIGDSLAVGYYNTHKPQATTAVVGSSPKAVLAQIQQLKKADVQGSSIILSSGLSNDTQQINYVEEQIQTLKAKGVSDIKLMGVAKNYKGNNQLGKELNDQLATLANKYGITFLGGFTAGSDKVHPNNNYYKSLVSKQTNNNTSTISKSLSATDIENSTIKQLPSGRWTSDNPLIARIIAIESMGNANAHRSGSKYKGLFQLNSNNKQDYNAKNYFDPHENFKLAKAVLVKNAIALQKAGIPITATSIYLTHQQGLGGFKAIYSASLQGKDIPYMPAKRKAGDDVRHNMDNNGGKGLSPKDFLAYWDKRIERDYTKMAETYGFKPIGLDTAQNASQSSTVAPVGLGGAIVPDDENTEPQAPTEQIEPQVNQEPVETVETEETKAIKQEAQSNITKRYSLTDIADTADVGKTKNSINELESTGAISTTLANNLRALLDIKVQIKGNTTAEVYDQIMNGKQGATHLESNLGLKQYEEVFSAGKGFLVNLYREYLDRFVNDHVSKANAIKQALKDFKGTSIILGFDEETNQWQRVETDGELAPNTRQFIVSTNRANATMKSIIQEAELLSKFRDHWFSILDGSVEPVESSNKQSDTITPPKQNKPVDKPIQASKGVSGKAVFVGRAHSKSMSDVANNNVAYQGMFGNPFTISKDKTGGYFVSNEQEQMDRYIHNVFANYSAHEYFRDEVLRSKSNGIRTGKNAHKEAKVIEQLNNFLETNPEYVSNPNKLTKIANRAYWDKDKGLVINVKQDKTDTDVDIHSNVITDTTDTAHSNDTDNSTPTDIIYEDANNDDYIQAQRELDLLYQGQFDDTNGYYEQDTSQQVNQQQDDDSLRSKVSGTSKHTRQAPKGINVKPVEIVNNKLDIKAGKHYLLDIVNTLGLNQDELFIVQAIAKKYPKLTISFDGTQADISSPKNITQAVVKYSTSQILSIINEDTTDTDLLGLRDELDLIQERIKQVNGLNELSKKEKALIEESISDYAKLILLGTSNDTLIGLLKRIETNGKARQSLFTKLINGMKSFLGIANKDSVHNLYERLLSVTGTLIDIQAKDNKVSYKNELFKQNDKTNIASINNLATRLKLYGVNGLQDKPNEIQEKELSYFLGFNDDFKQHLIASYDEHGNKYKDLKALLNQGTKDNPKFDENIYTALALIAYEYLKVNGGSIYNKSKDVNKLLGVDIELDLPHEIYKKYLLAGKSINEVTTILGRDVVKLLDYEANANTPATTIARLEASMGSWLLSAMQVADMVNIHEFNQAEYENDKRIVQGLEANVAKTDKIIKTVSFTALDNTATNDVIDEVISHSKGTQNYLSNLFGLESRKVYPLLKPSNYVNDTIQRTKAKVSKKQQALVQSMQQEAIVLNQDMYGVMSALQEMDSTFLADVFGARVTDEQLAKKHISKRLSMQATAEAIQRDLDHYFEWANSLPTTDTKFYDRIKVVINDRMHYASNVFNFQSSKVHRALGEYDSFKTEIDLTDFDGSTWFDKDNKPLAITLFLRAVFENAEGTEDIFKEQFIKYGLADGHTVDKVPSDIFMPVAWNYLTTDKQVANAVLAMQSLLAGNTLNQQQKQDILDLVKAWDMQGQSFRALLEITNLFTAIENNTAFTTSLGLGSDGINNGTAIGFILNAIDNVITLARVGIFKKDTPFTNYFQTRNIKEIGDYYTAYMPVLAEAINGLDNNTQAFEYLNNTLFTRKMAKAILIPFGYGAGTKRLIQASSGQMMKDIISRIEDIVKTNNVDEYNKLQQAISAVTNYKLAPIDKLLETPIPEYVEFNLRESYEQVMGKAIAQSIKEYAGELITRRDNHIAIHNAITEQYLSLRALVEAKAEQERIKRLEAKYKGKELNEAIKYQTLTKEEIAKYIDEPLAKIYPKLHSAYSQDESASVGFDLLDRASTLIQDDGVDNRAYQYTGDNKLSAKSIKTLVRAKVLQSAGVRPYSQQIQHMDSYVSAHASTANGVVSINVHDANIGSMSNYIAMTIAQNKAFFDGTLNYHAYYQNLSALVSAMNGFKELDIELNQEQMNELVVSWFKPMLKGDSLKQFKQATLQGRVFNQAMVDTILGLAYAGLQADIAKLDMYANTQSIQQYAGEAGEYILTDKDYEQIQAIKTKLVADSNKLYDELQQALQAYTPSKVVAIEGVHYGKGGDTWDVSKVTPNNIHKPYIWDKLLPAFIDGKKLSVQGEDQSKAKQIAEYLLDYLVANNNNTQEVQHERVKTVSDLSSKSKINIWFGSGENAHLSNLALRPFTAKNGKTYQSVEHFYQSHKTGKFNQTLYDNPAWFKAGTKLAQGKPKTQDNYNISLMRAGIKFSFEQNPQALAQLLATGNQILTHTQDKGIWAKEFPRLLMEVRDELRKNEPTTQNQQDKPKLKPKQLGLFDEIVFGERQGLFDLPDIPIVNIKAKHLGFNDTKQLTDEILRQLQGKNNLVNDDTGWILQVGKKDRKKMGNNKNLSHATSQAIQGLVGLVKNAVVAETHQDIKHENPDVKAVHRLYVPAMIDGQLYRVKLTTKDYTFTTGQESKKSLHAIEAVEIENALLGTLPPYSTSTDVQVAQPTTGHKLSVRDLLDGVKHDGDNNSFGFKPVQESRVLDKKTKITYKDISFHTKSFDINQVTKAVSKYGLDGTAQAKLFSILAIQTKLNPKVKFVIDDADKQKGYYNTLTNTIHLNQALTDTKDKLATINHELIHALTETGLRQGGKAVDDLTKMYHQLKDKAQGQFAKELENIHEFASYGLTDDNFANFIANNLDLKAIGIKPKNRLASAFEAFVQAMYSVLGLKRSVAYKTFVNAVMDSMVVYQAIGTETKRNNQDIFTVPTVVQSTFNKDIDNLETSLRSNPRPVTTNMPPVLLALDGKQGLAIKDLPLELDKFTLRKMQGKVSGKADDSYALTLADIKSLLPELYNPVAVLVSDNLQGLTVIISMTKNGHEILVPIHLNKSKGKYVFNDIASAFGKENFNAWFSKRIDKVIYYNKNLTSSTLPHRLGKLDTSHVGVVDDVSTFPKVVPTASKVNQSIATPDDIIKRYSRIQLDDVVDDLETQARVLQGKPVVSVYEDDLNMPKSGGFKAITVWAKELFNAWDNKAINHKLGEVSLNDQSIRDSLAHGFNPYKNIAFASVKSVIEKGSIVAIDTRNGKDSIYISAPVLINGLENIVTVLVHRDINTQRMYLHSIMLKENLLVPRDSKAPTKVGKQNGSMTPVGVSTTQSRVSETQETSSRKHIGSLTEETDKIPAGLRISEAPVSTGKQNSSIAPAGNPSSKHKGMLTSMDIRNILHTALTYKGKRYSQATTAETIADTINQMSTTEVFKQLSRGSISDEHNTHLDGLVDMLIEGYTTRYNSVKSSDPIKGKLKNKARLNGFKSSEKESYITRALIEVISQYRQNHKGSIAVNQMDRAFNQALKDYPNVAKFFSHYHSASKEEQQRLNKMYQYVFKNQDKEDNVARFMAMVLANEEFRLAMTQVKPSKEIDGWFDWVMDKVQSILDWFTTKLFKSDKALDGYVKALVYLEKQARLEHTDSLQKIYAYVQQTMTKLADKPVLGAIKLATKLPYIKQHSMTKALATVLDNPQIANRWVSDTFADTRQQTFIDFMAELGQFGNRGQFIDKATRLTSKIAQDRQVIKSSMIKVLNGLFDKELSKEAKTAITYALLRTDMSALIRHGFKETLSLLDKTKRDKEIAKQLALLKPLVSDEAYQDMIYQMQALAKYMVVGEATPALVKSAQGIAQGLGSDYQTKTLNQEVFKIVDVLTTLYALDFVENKHIKQLQSLDSKALMKVLDIHKEQVIKSQDEFKHSPLNYTKGYLPDITNPQHKLVFATSDDEIAQYKAQGFVELYKLNQDPADDTEQRTLMLHDSYASRDYVSGAIDLYDKHAKGTIIYTDQDVANIEAKIKKDREFRQARLLGLNPEVPSSVLVPTYHTDGSIMNYHYEMNGYTKDTYLERNNDFDLLLANLASDLVYKPMVEQLQKEIAKWLYQDSITNYAKHPRDYRLIHVYDDVMARILPYTMRNEIYRLWGKGTAIPIHKSVYTALLGYEAYSLVNIFDKLANHEKLNFAEKALVWLLTKLFGNQARKNLLHIEKSVQQLMQLIKDVIVIRSGTVLLGNIFANTLLLALHGINPIRILQDTLFAWRNVKRYSKDINELEQVKIKLLADNSQLLQTKKKTLEQAIKNNPLHEYMQQGMMSTIVEDLDTQKVYQYETMLDKQINKLRDKVNPKLLKTFDVVAMNSGSIVHDFLTEATQFSDFSAKYVLANYLQEQGKKLDNTIHEANLSFINYDIPTNKALDYFNRIGLMMFTKFFLRFQNVLWRLGLKLPARVLGQHFVIENLGQQGVLDPFFVNRLGNPFDDSIFNGLFLADDLLTSKVVSSIL